MHDFRLLILAILVAALDAVSAGQINRHASILSTRQSQNETKIEGNCTQMNNMCHLPDREDQICPADYNRCPLDGAPCALIEPTGDSSRKPEIRCGFLGST